MEPATHAAPEIGSPNPLDGQSVAPPPTPRVRRPDLATLTDVRREMSRVYREMRTKKVASQDGTRLTYVLTAIAKIIEGSDLQARIEKLEALLQQRSMNGNRYV